MAHHYDVGDQVSLAFGFHDQNAVGLYIVTRRLPSLVDGEPQYRVGVSMIGNGSSVKRRSMVQPDNATRISLPGHAARTTQ